MGRRHTFACVAAALVLQTGCGRFGFDERGPGGSGGGDEAEWLLTFPADDSVATGIAVDNQGRTTAAIRYDTMATTPAGDVLVGDNDTFIVGLGPSGEQRWLGDYGNGDTGVLNFFSLAVAGSGNSVAGGLGNGSLSFGTFDLSPGSSQDALIVVHDPEGNVVEATNFDGSGSNAQGQAVSVNASGEISLGGLYGNTLDVDGTTLSGNGTDNGFVFALDAQRNLRFADSHVSSEFVAVLATSIGGDGRVCAGGYFEGPIDLGDGVPRDTINSNSAGDGFLVQYAPDGAFESAFVVGSNAADRVFVTSADDSGCVFAGRVCGPSAEVSEHFGICDAYAARVSTDGTLQWIVPMGGSGQDRATGLQVAPDGRVFVFGEYGAEMQLGGFRLDANTGSGSFMAILDANGAAIELRGLSSEDSRIDDASISENGEFVIVGGAFTGVLEHAGQIVDSAEERHAFVARIVP